jgi:hypothetical protein
MKVAVFFSASRKFLCVCVKNELVFYGYLHRSILIRRDGARTASIEIFNIEFI